MKNLGDLAKSMAKLAVNLPIEVNRLSIACAETILFDLVKKTPVDTSNALSNWIVSLGSIYGREIPPHFYGSMGSTYNESSNMAYQLGKNALQEKFSGESIFISNSVDYIVDLNNGTSKQEPAGFVYRAYLLGKLEVDRWRLFSSVGSAPGTGTTKIPMR